MRRLAPARPAALTVCGLAPALPPCNLPAMAEYVPPPYQVQPARSGWGRFWLGVLTGGCAVLLLEAVVVLALAAFLGAAIGSALRHPATGIGGIALPSGLSLPSGLPRLQTSSDPCSPQPCLAHGGVTVLISGVNRDAGASGSGAHVVQFQVTFVGTSGSHTVTADEVVLSDSAGNLVLPSADAAGDCGGGPGAQQLAAGQRLGPYTACYAVDGAVGAPLSVAWVDPEDFSIVQTRL